MAENNNSEELTDVEKRRKEKLASLIKHFMSHSKKNEKVLEETEKNTLVSATRGFGRREQPSEHETKKAEQER
jgi:hypothetical protein